MYNKIIICCRNGAGKSTLGKAHADKINYKFMDIEDYYFPKSESDYPYDNARTMAEVSALLLEDMKKYTNFILSSVKGDLYEKEKNFFDMVQNRSDQDVENWLKSTRIPTIQVDGTNTVLHNIEIIIDKITDF